MIAVLSQFGVNAEAIWVFAAGVLTVLFTAALVLMGVSLIKTLINK